MSVPADYFVRLQKGIVGGFAPPTPDAIFTIAKSAEAPQLLVTAAVRPAGTPELQESAAPKFLSASASSSLVEELYSILKGLPTEQPPGSEDIYGLDTSIAFGSADLEWTNGGPQGCSGGTSTVQPTAEQKEQFKRAVAIIQELVDKES